MHPQPARLAPHTSGICTARWYRRADRDREPVQSDRELTNLIRRKFSIKCTTGYSINALVDFPVSDPVEIIKRLLIGSEGTLGFVSRATYNTVPEWPNKASAFIVFPDVRSACAAASVLRDETAVDAVELFDRCSPAPHARMTHTHAPPSCLC